MRKPIRLTLGLLVVASAMISGGCTSLAVPGDSPPIALVQAQPYYPLEMKRLGQTGQVTVGFIIDTEGMPRDLYVMSSTDKAFEEPAMIAVSKWRFKPGIRNGRRVNTRMSVPINFDMVPVPN